jgi:hypothetical protein
MFSHLSCSEYYILKFTDVSDIFNALCLLFGLFFDLGDKSSTSLRNVGFLPGYTMPHTRRECSSFLLFISVISAIWALESDYETLTVREICSLVKVTAKVAVFWCVASRSHRPLIVLPCSLVDYYLL